jgi:hypothetical protein
MTYYTYQSPSGRVVRVVAPHVEAVIRFARSTGKGFTTPKPCPNEHRSPHYTIDEEGELR